MTDAVAIAAITGTTSAVIAWIGYLNGRRQATVALETNERQARAALQAAERQAQVELAKVAAETDRFQENQRREHIADLRRVYSQFLNAIDAQKAAGQSDAPIDEKARVFDAANVLLTDTLNELRLVASEEVSRAAEHFQVAWRRRQTRDDAQAPPYLSEEWFTAWEIAMADAIEERAELWRELVTVFRLDLARAEGRAE